MRVPLACLALVCLAAPACSSGEPDAESDAPTFHRDIAPLAAERCASCHQSGGVAWPWPEQPAEAQRNAAALAEAVQSRRMPPWPPASDCAELVGERRLGDDEIARFADWAAAGAPLGEPRELAAPEPPRLRDPDVQLELPAYAPAGGDDFRCFVVDPHAPRRELVSGIDVTAARQSSVHHAVALRMDRDGASALSPDARAFGWACGDLPSVPFDELLGAWASGAPPLAMPEGTGLVLDSQHVVLLHLHYFGGKGVPVQGSLDIRYAADGASEARIVPVTDYDFSIAPQTSGVSSISTRPGSLYTSQPARILGVMPHMHELGRSFALERERADGKSCVMRVPSWDPYYQELYFLAEPGVELVPTDTLRLGCTWDNPTDREVGWGTGARDEMCVGYLYLVAGGG